MKPIACSPSLTKRYNIEFYPFFNYKESRSVEDLISSFYLLKGIILGTFSKVYIENNIYFLLMNKDLY